MKKSKANALIDILTAISLSPSMVSKVRQNPELVFKPIPNLTKNEMERLASGDKVVINTILSGRASVGGGFDIHVDVDVNANANDVNADVSNVDVDVNADVSEVDVDTALEQRGKYLRIDEVKHQINEAAAWSKNLMRTREK